MTQTNWAQNLEYRAATFESPGTVDELANLLAESTGPVRALGTRHCFNDIADTDGTLVSVASLPAVIEPDAERRVVRVAAGLRYGDIAPTLDEAGFALANLASLPHISVAGAVATGTHGSGDTVGSLASAVAALEFVTPAGELTRLERGDADFDGAVVSLGALGVVTTIELDIEPRFEVAQTVYESLPVNDVLADLDAVTSLGYSTSLFTTWQNPDVIDQLWVKARVDQPARDVPFRAATSPRHPLPGVSAENCTTQGGVPGAWYDRLPHFKLGFLPSAGEELQSEYLVPRADAVAAIEALRGLADRIAPLLFVSEVRTLRRDSLWLSSAFETDAVGLHFTWKQDQPAVEALLPVIEAALPATARPHWGKLFSPNIEPVALYPRWADFAALRDRFDPQRTLINPYLARLGL
ncbi:FAD-binding protein [Agromyces atrinae]|uniref:FAD-binding protein n=1 Tax=Agromyces atrinae TaxID=592376 RepID=UPI001F59C414|nr:FAD-binding protein [Agromyces atrinae]MCI2957705.1 FAD-binding protein [Agromyces atrinae]